LTLGCTEAQRQRIAANQWQQQAAQAEQDRVIVTPADLSGQKYRLLGPVEWPGQGNIALFGSPCEPHRLRAEAIEKYGSRVDAVIGYTQWRDGQQMRCAGTAVEFENPGSSSVADHSDRDPKCMYSADGILIKCDK
jgi:hypothetical protein